MSNHFIILGLEGHLNEVKKRYDFDQILGIFLYGSQNYNNNTANSDIDSKVILVPTINDLCLQRPISEEIQFENNEHCEVKDIREMVKMFKKQNINFLEILYTDYFILNPKYEKVWNENFLNIKDDIVRMDIRATIKSITGQIKNTLNRYPENGKQISNALRFTYFLRYFLAGWNYKDCINIRNYDPEIRNLIMSLKMGLIERQEDKDKIIKSILEDTEKLVNRIDDYPVEPDKAIAAALDKATINVITKNNFNFNFY